TIYKELDSQDLLTVATLATVFCTSYETIVYRLHTLGYVNDNQRDGLLNPSERQRDERRSLQHRASGRVGPLRTAAVVAALTDVGAVPYCNKCSAMILNRRWIVCYRCGSDLV